MLAGYTFLNNPISLSRKSKSLLLKKADVLNSVLMRSEQRNGKSKYILVPRAKGSRALGTRICLKFTGADVLVGIEYLSIFLRLYKAMHPSSQDLQLSLAPLKRRKETGKRFAHLKNPPRACTTRP